MGDLEDRRPCFYKIILDNEPERRIPPEFLKHIAKDYSDTATLRVVSGGSWTVKMNIIGNDVFMQDGWQEFVRDNSLVNTEFLYFKYDGNMCFSVSIFDPNGVERIGTCNIRMHQESAGFSNDKRPKGRPKKDPVDSLNRHHHPFNSCEEMPEVQGHAYHKSKKLKTTEKVKNVNNKSEMLKTTEKGKNLNRQLQPIIRTKITALNANLEKKKYFHTPKKLPE